MSTTIKDIAKKTGLGLATISSYLNGGNVREKNRIKIANAIEELDFEVNEIARGLKTNTSKTIGIVIPDLNVQFCTEIITNIEDELRKNGYATIVCDCGMNGQIEKDVIKFLYKKRVDGVINIPFSHTGEHLKPFIDNKKPVVLIDSKINGIEANHVLVDNVEAVKNGIEYLIRMGHKKIGIINGPKDTYTAQNRQIGYTKAYSDAGLIEEERFIENTNYSMNAGLSAIKRLVKRNKDMTAVFVCNGEMTLGALIGINELGISIKEDLSFFGFDNVELARAVKPKITIIAQPVKKIGELTAKLMLDRLKGVKDGFEDIVLETKMIDGDSIKRI